MMFAELAARQSAAQDGNSEGFQRPPNPFTMSQPILQKKTEKEFTEHDFTEYINQTSINATSRLRLLDSIRLHSPLEGECKRLNIPNNRLNVLVLKDVLYLCGARFTSEDLTGAKVLYRVINFMEFD